MTKLFYTLHIFNLAQKIYMSIYVDKDFCFMFVCTMICKWNYKQKTVRHSFKFCSKRRIEHIFKNVIF